MESFFRTRHQLPRHLAPIARLFVRLLVRFFPSRCSFGLFTRSFFHICCLFFTKYFLFVLFHQVFFLSTVNAVSFKDELNKLPALFSPRPPRHRRRRRCFHRRRRRHKHAPGSSLTRRFMTPSSQLSRLNKTNGEGKLD